VQTPGRLIRVSTFACWLYASLFPLVRCSMRKGRDENATQRYGRKGRSSKASRVYRHRRRTRRVSPLSILRVQYRPPAFSQCRNAESPITSRERKASPLRPRWRAQAPRTLCYFSYSLLFFLLIPSWKYYGLDCIGGSCVATATATAARGCINLRKLFLSVARQREWESASQLIREPCPCGRRACLNGWQVLKIGSASIGRS